MNEKRSFQWNSSIINEYKEILSDVAEPIHRVGPHGVSSGISFRTLPETSFEQIQKVCLHYVNKCSGKYENNKMAARYVHQLAKEVISLLGGIADEIESSREIRKLAEERLADWDRNFPNSLKIIGGPKEVAERLIEMQNEINRLYNIIDQLNIQLNEEKQKSITTIDEQLHLSSISVMREREKLTEEVRMIKEESNLRIKELEKRYEQEIQRIHQFYKEKKEKLESKYQMKLNEQKKYFEKEYSTSIEVLQEKLKIETNERLKEREINFKKREKVEMKLKQLQQRIEAEENEGNELISDSTNDNIVPNNSNLSTQIKNNDHQLDGLVSKRDGKRTRLEMKRKLISLQQSLESIEEKLQHQLEINQSLTLTLSSTRDELNLCRKQLSSQNEYIESLRFGLSLNFKPSDGEHIYSHPNPLQYIIPDFLQHPQKNILNNPSSNTK